MTCVYCLRGCDGRMPAGRTGAFPAGVRACERVSVRVCERASIRSHFGSSLSVSSDLCAIAACHRVDFTMPMECPQCGLQQSFRKYWTEAQTKHGSPSVGGRNYCIECYNQGPRPEDWREVSNWLSQIMQWSTTHQHNKYE